jgi:hypothetical protein
LLSIKGFSQSKKGDLRLTVAGVPLVTATDGSENGLSGFALKTGLGYFFNDKFSIDFSVNYTTNDALLIEGIASNYNSYSAVSSFRYSFLNKEKLRLFTELGFGLGTIKYEADDILQSVLRHEQNSGGISVLNLGIGGEYFFNSNFGLQLIVPYLNVKNITSNHLNTIYNGLAPTVGVTFKIN